ncbi:hypothetical protein [Burkholderia ambifaria]|uniref:Uncharacterized protein n=1 Tax=Burkholderia ambifaria TaxID=152480 RepID=A0AA41JJP9_9BURK|nr:hypothetical protein [Burkholderia ambifaria]MBR8130056.1 hypothetical protein [Burkholderia ambifaria]UEP51883.1 hypothetical protein LMA00_20840 [Burkholderia ambifaria]
MNSSSGAQAADICVSRGPRAEYFELTRIISRNLEAGRAMQNMHAQNVGSRRFRIITARLADDFDLNPIVSVGHFV